MPVPIPLTHSDHGTGDPPLVFVPGWCCDRTFFAPQVEHFRRSHRVIAVDLRGCGETAVPDEGYDLETLTADVAALCESLRLEQPVIVGHSLGGMIGVQLAASRPELVGAVIGVDPGPFDPLPDVHPRFLALAEAIEREDGVSARQEYIRAMFLDADDPGAKRHAVEAMCAVPPHVAASVLRGVVGWNGAAALRACSVPLLAVLARPAGSNAPDRLLALNPNVSIGVTVGSGHFNQLVVPEQVNAMIERFVLAL